jgi:ISXO2-like transposase domain
LHGFGSYETAWAWLHKVRRAMVRPDRDQLSGGVELDEAFLGGQSAGKKGGASDKIPVIIAVERVGPRKLGRVRFGIDDAPGTHRMLEFATATIAPGSTIHNDEARFLRGLAEMGYQHSYATGYNAPGIGQVLPGVHLVASLLKRWLAGTLQHQVSLAHLPYHLDEYAFRFNRRTSTAPGMPFYRLMQQALATDPHPLDALTAWLAHTVFLAGRVNPFAKQPYAGSRLNASTCRGRTALKWRRSSVMTSRRSSRSARATTDASTAPSGKSAYRRTSSAMRVMSASVMDISSNVPVATESRKAASVAGSLSSSQQTSTITVTGSSGVPISEENNSTQRACWSSLRLSSPTTGPVSTIVAGVTTSG